MTRFVRQLALWSWFFSVGLTPALAAVMPDNEDLPYQSVRPRPASLQQRIEARLAPADLKNFRASMPSDARAKQKYLEDTAKRLGIN